MVNLKAVTRLVDACRRVFGFLVALAFGTVLALPAPLLAQGFSPAPASVRAQLAPTGTLRMAMTQANFFVVKAPDTGELRGIAIDLGRELAKILEVPFEPLLYRTRDFNKLLEGAAANSWDIAIMGLDPARESLVAYTAPVMEIDLTLLVGPGSNITSIDDMDRAGNRIAVSRNTIGDLTLSRVVKAAEVVRTLDGGFAELVAGRVDAYASQRPVLVNIARQLPGSRVLDGRYDAARPALAVHRSRDVTVGYLRDFVEHAKRSGFVARAIEKAGIAARVALPDG